MDEIRRETFRALARWCFFYRCSLMAFLTQTKLPVEHAFFDGGQFAQIGKGTRRIMTPFLYFAIRSLYWSKGGTLKKVLWCDDDSIKPYFIAAGGKI